MVILVCIIISIVVFMLETMPELDSVPHYVWSLVEVFCTVVFTLEYSLRLIVCGVVGTTVWRFLRTPMNLVDLAAILPFYLWLGMQHIQITKALGILRTVRLVRLFRVFKLGRYSSGLQLMTVALKNSSHALWVLSFFLGMGVVLFSSAVYYVEKMGCPDRGGLALNRLGDGTNRTQLDHYVQECQLRPSRANAYGICCNEYDSPLDFPTIVEAFWWSIVTTTTVGFGDVRPRTALGKAVGTATMLSGILLIALPVAIIGRKFQEAYASFLERQSLAHGGDGVSRAAQHEAGGQLSMAEMGRRLKLMRLPEAGLAVLARELAEELEEVGAVQREVVSMQAFEQARQLQAVEHFGVVVSQLCHLSKPSGPTASSRAQLVAGAFQAKPRRAGPAGSATARGTARCDQSLNQILESNKELQAHISLKLSRQISTQSQRSLGSPRPRSSRSPSPSPSPSRTSSWRPVPVENVGG